METSNLHNIQQNESIVSKPYNGGQVVSEFFNYYYQTWITNPRQLINDKIIKYYSKLNYNQCIYEGDKFIELLLEFASHKLQFIDCKYEFIDSGSRQIYILVTGTIINSLYSEERKFSQSFMITYAGEKYLKKWTLINSILII
jgi:hypothetical protein